MSGNSDNARRRAWGAYWASGLLHSCADDSGRNYGGAIGAFWHRWLSAVEPGCRVLDLATGNGPLPQLLHELHKGVTEVDAIDLADVAPGWHDPAVHRNIRFHAGVSMEALPFPDASFDVVISQFGFEYAERKAALSECLRVAKPDASLALVMHHADSVLVDVGREELRHHALLIAGDGLLGAAADVFPWIAKIRGGAAPDHLANLARQGYNRALADLADAAAVSRVPDLLLDARATVHRLLARVDNETLSTALVDLHAYGQALEGARLRTSEMIACALDDADINEMAERLRVFWPDKHVQCLMLRQEEGVVAWVLAADPSGVSMGQGIANQR